MEVSGALLWLGGSRWGIILHRLGVGGALCWVGVGG